MKMHDDLTEKIISLAGSLPNDEIQKRLDDCLINRQYGSRLAPDREADTWAGAFYDPDKEVFLVIGTGRLHYHKALIKRLKKSQTFFILDWKLPLIAAALADGMDPGAQPTIVFRFLRSFPEMMLSIMGIFDRYLTRPIKLGIIPPYQFMFPEESEKIQTQLKEFITINLVRSVTIELFGLEWTTNIHRNLPHMLQRGIPFKHLAGQFQNVPAVVVSAGPSLEKNVRLLTEISDRAVIIAAGSSIETMVKEYGIIPHFLASFDAGAGNYPHFQRLDTKPLRLIFTGDIYPRILEEFEGVLIPLEASSKQTYSLYKKYGAPTLGEAKVGPSVANFALDIAVQLGCNPVVLIGQDLALRDGKSHARGNYYCTDFGAEDLSAFIQVKGNADEFVYTTKSWLTMLKFFEDQIKSYGQHTIINATEGGAFIQGTVVRSLREVIDQHMTERRGVEEKISSALKKPPELGGPVEEILSKVLAEAQEISGLINRTLPEIDRLLIKLKNGTLKQKNQKMIRDIKKKEDHMLASEVYQHIIRTIIYGRIFYYERHYTRLAAEQPRNVELWVAEYQKILFESARDALNVYLEEVRPATGNTDF